MKDFFFGVDLKNECDLREEKKKKEEEEEERAEDTTRAWEIDAFTGAIKEKREQGGGGNYIEWGNLTKQDKMNENERMNTEELKQWIIKMMRKREKEREVSMER